MLDTCLNQYILNAFIQNNHHQYSLNDYDWQLDTLFYSSLKLFYNAKMNLSVVYTPTSGKVLLELSKIVGVLS